jgi:hypothetical protein
MTRWIFCRVSSDTGRLPLSAYETVLRETPARRAISPMFTGLLLRTGSMASQFVEPVRVKGS